MQLSQQRLKVLQLLYNERMHVELAALSVEDLAQQLGISRADAWNELTYLEASGYVSITSRQFGSIIHYTLAITRRGIDVVEANLPIQVGPTSGISTAVSEIQDTLLDSRVQFPTDASVGQPPLQGEVSGIPSPGIFLSHSSEDVAFCRRLMTMLWRNFPDADVFYDESELKGGDDFVRRIPAELMKRPLFIVVLSEHAAASPWVQEETLLALREAVKNQERSVIPVLYRDCDTDALSPLLRSRQIIDCAYQDESLGFGQLVAVIQDLTRRSDRSS